MNDDGSRRSDRADRHYHRHHRPRRSVDRGRSDDRHIRDEESDRRRSHRDKQRRSHRSLSPRPLPPADRRRPHHSQKESDNEKPSRLDVSLPKQSVVDINHNLEQPPDNESSESDEVLGPMPAALSPQDGKPRRALRRGESGYNPEDIERFEQMGFVMSGSRRKGKQNEEASKKGDFKSQKKEKALQEMELVARFKEMIEERNAMKKQI